MAYASVAEAVVPLLSPVLTTYTDYAGQVDPPYCVVTEPGEERRYYSPAGLTISYGPGQLQVDIYASSRTSAYSLGEQVAAALLSGDASGIPFGVLNRLDALRLQSAAFAPLPDTGVSTPAIFHRVLVFSYWCQRSN